MAILNVSVATLNVRFDQIHHRQLPHPPARAACSKTLLEKSGAKGAKTRIIVVGRVRIWFTSFDGSVTSVPYPSFLKMAKVQLSTPRRA